MILRCRHRDLNDTLRQILIFDRDNTASDFIDFLTDEDFLEIESAGDVNNMHKTIISTTCRFSMIGKSSEYDEDTQTAIDNFINDLGNSYEGRYYVRVVYGEGFNMTSQEFIGKIIPEVGDTLLNDEEKLLIVATDGLSDLKNIEFRPLTYTDTTPELNTVKYSIKELVRDILLRNDVCEFFSNLFTTNMFTFSLNWEETVSQLAGDLSSQMYLRNYWWEQKSPSYRKYQSCYEVLDDILTGLAARIYWADGAWHVEQIGYQDNANPIIYGYDSAGTVRSYASKVNIDYSGDSNWQSLAYNTRRNMPALKAVVLEQGNTFTNYIEGIAWVHDTTYSFNVIGDGAKLILQMYMDVSTSFNVATLFSESQNYYNVYLEWNITIRIGSYYLKSIAPGGVYVVVDPSGVMMPIGECEWTTSVSTVKIVHYQSVQANTPGVLASRVAQLLVALKVNAIIIESLELPVDGELTIRITSFQAKIENVTLATTYNLNSSSRMILGSSYKNLYEQPPTIKKYEVGNIRNSLIYDIKCGYYDSAVDKKSAIWMINSAHTAGVKSVSWRDKDNPDDVMPFQELLMRTILASRAKPTLMYKMVMYSLSITSKPLNMRNRCIIDGELYYPVRLTVKGSIGHYDVTWARVFKDFDGINVVVDDTGEPDAPNPFPPVGIDSLTPVNNGGGSTLVWYGEWTNVTVNYLVPTYNLDLLSTNEWTIKTKVHLYSSGVRQRYMEYTNGIILQPRQWTIDMDNDRILIFKGTGPISHLELMIYE